MRANAHTGAGCAAPGDACICLDDVEDPLLHVLQRAFFRLAQVTYPRTSGPKTASCCCSCCTPAVTCSTVERRRQGGAVAGQEGCVGEQQGDAQGFASHLRAVADRHPPELPFKAKAGDVCKSRAPLTALRKLGPDPQDDSPPRLAFAVVRHAPRLRGPPHARLGVALTQGRMEGRIRAIYWRGVGSTGRRGHCREGTG